MQTSASTMEELATELGFAGYVTEIRMGRVVWTLAYADTVQTATVFDTRCTMARIRSEAIRAGIDCTDPQALAAAYSVPDGAPIAMALVNVGPLPSDNVVREFTTMRDRMSGAIRVMTRG